MRIGLFFLLFVIIAIISFKSSYWRIESYCLNNGFGIPKKIEQQFIHLGPFWYAGKGSGVYRVECDPEILWFRINLFMEVYQENDNGDYSKLE